MIEIQDQRALVLPASRWFVFLSIIAALILNLVPLGKPLWRPDLVAVVLMFWCVRQPKYIVFTFVFFLGLVMDTHQSVLLGEHALGYTIISFFAVLGARRMAWFNLKGQMLHVFPLFLLLHAVNMLVHLIHGDSWPGNKLLLAPVIETMLWPVAYFILYAPQRRTRDKVSF